MAMNYELANIVPSEISYNVDQALPYGDIPHAMLAAKFEETDIGADEDAYDNYARNTLMDRLPDKNKFEHEEPRGAVNMRSGKLQLQYYGHRGNADDPAHPEMFLGFGGPDDRDPRGTATDPDMKQLKRQWEERMRFVNWTPDGSDHITGGGRSEDQVMKDQQELFRTTRDRLKVFDRSVDGRKSGVSKVFKRRPAKEQQMMVQSYGDMITDFAVNPQKRANVMCSQIIRDAKSYRVSSMDQDLQFARYTQLCRRARARSANKSTVGVAQSDAKFASSDSNKSFKASGILMSRIVKQREEVARAGGDIDMANSRTAEAFKNVGPSKDLALILKSTTTGGDFGSSDLTPAAKTPGRTGVEHTMRNVSHNHSIPAHHYINAEMILKSVKPGCDTRKIKDKIITDADLVQLSQQDVSGKSAKRTLFTGKKLNTQEEAERQESCNTYNYRRAHIMSRDSKITVTSGEDFKKESDPTRNCKSLQSNYRVTNSGDIATQSKFYDNTVKERLTGGMGNKYMHKFIDTDGKTNDICGLN